MAAELAIKIESKQYKDDGHPLNKLGLWVSAVMTEGVRDFEDDNPVLRGRGVMLLTGLNPDAIYNPQVTPRTEIIVKPESHIRTYEEYCSLFSNVANKGMIDEVYRIVNNRGIKTEAVVLVGNRAVDALLTEFEPAAMGTREAFVFGAVSRMREAFNDLGLRKNLALR